MIPKTTTMMMVMIMMITMKMKMTRKKTVAHSQYLTGVIQIWHKLKSQQNSPFLCLQYPFWHQSSTLDRLNQYMAPGINGCPEPLRKRDKLPPSTTWRYPRMMIITKTTKHYHYHHHHHKKNNKYWIVYRFKKKLLQPPPSPWTSLDKSSSKRAKFQVPSSAPKPCGGRPGTASGRCGGRDPWATGTTPAPDSPPPLNIMNTKMMLNNAMNNE